MEIRMLRRQLAHSERTRQDLSNGLRATHQDLELHQQRCWAFVEGIENFIHLSMGEERRLLLEQLDLAFHRQGIEFDWTDPEETESDNEVFMFEEE